MSKLENFRKNEIKTMKEWDQNIEAKWVNPTHTVDRAQSNIDPISLIEEENDSHFVE